MIMRIRQQIWIRASLVVALILIATATRLRADSGTCSGQMITLPFTDVAGSIFFCTIAEAYFSGLTNGTDATHYSPSANVTRDQMSAFITRTLDQSLKRGSERAILDQFWTTRNAGGMGLTDLGSATASGLASDGLDVWVAAIGDVPGADKVFRVRGSTGNLLQTWTGAIGATGVLVARGKIFITSGFTSPGTLYSIDPSQPPGSVTTVTTSLGDGPGELAYDGQHIWTENSNSVSKVTLNPLSVDTYTAGVASPTGILYDGSHIWITNAGGDNKLKQLDSNGNVLLSVPVGDVPFPPVFDGTNIWVPNNLSHTVSVVRAVGGLAGTVLATLSGNGLTDVFEGAFDGERILITNFEGSASLWRATDFAPLGHTSPAGTHFTSVCSDGLNFWVLFTNSSLHLLARL
jgi:hypothetical protein